MFDIYSNSKFRYEVCSCDRVVNWKNNTDRHDSGMKKEQRKDKLANVTNGSVISHFDLEASFFPRLLFPFWKGIGTLGTKVAVTFEEEWARGSPAQG